MYKELQKCIKYYENNDNKEMLLERIQFFQHERLVHLIITLFVGFMAIIFFGLFITIKDLLLGVVFIILFILFIPYIIHYYRLENGVQKLYKIYYKKR